MDGIGSLGASAACTGLTDSFSSLQLIDAFAWRPRLISGQPIKRRFQIGDVDRLRQHLAEQPGKCRFAKGDASGHSQQRWAVHTEVAK